MRDIEELQKFYNWWVEETLRCGNQVREGKWTETIAVGSKEFVEATAEWIGIKGKGRRCRGKQWIRT